jgi:type I restriction enzyme, S subunit
VRKNYPSYKESGVDWIGNIPNRWKVKRGKFLLENKKEKNLNLQCENLLCLTLKGVLKKDILSNEGLRPSDYKKYQIFYPNDLVFKLIDLENIKTSRVGLVSEKGIMSPVYIRLESKNNYYYKYYYYQYYDLYKKNIYNSLGDGVRSSLSPTDLLEIPLIVPSLPEQKKIVKYLDYKTQIIDKLIDKTKKKIELLKEKRTALINHCVTKGLNPNVEMKDSEVEWIGKIPKEWKIKKLKYFASLITDKKECNDSDIKISPENVESFNGRCINLYSEYSGMGVPFEPGDILFNKLRLYLVKILLPNYKGFSMGEMIVIRTNKNVSNKFYFYLFFNQGLIDFLDSQSTGVKVPRVSPEIIMGTYLPFPKPEEQDRIAKYLDDETQKIDTLIDKENKRIKLLQEYRKSLISEVVTGKIDVRDEVVA